MTDSPVLCEIRGATAWLTLNRPAAGNTVDMPLAQALSDHARACAEDRAVRCVVLTGAGRLFCGGGDLGAMLQAGEDVPAYLAELAGTFHSAIATLANMEKPLVTLINGPAAGAGLSLAIAGDIVIAARSASFLAAYGSVGLSPDGGMSWTLPRLVGMRWAQKMILANHKVDAVTATAIGLASELAEDADLLATGQAWAERLAGLATGSIAKSRRLLQASFQNHLTDHLDLELNTIVAAGGSAECREGVSAFASGRAAQFHQPQQAEY